MSINNLFRRTAMKKTITVIFVILLISLFPITALADNTITVDEFGLSVTMPSDYYVLTRDMEQTASAWDMFNEEEQKQLLQIYIDSDTYINAISQDITNEIVVVISQDPNYEEMLNFNLYEDKELYDLFFESISDKADKYAYSSEDLQVYKTDNLKFLVYSGHTSQNGQSLYSKSYFSVVNGYFLQCFIRSSNGPLSKELEITIKDVVDSIKFESIQTKPVPVQTTPPVQSQSIVTAPSDSVETVPIQYRNATSSEVFFLRLIYSITYNIVPLVLFIIALLRAYYKGKKSPALIVIGFIFQSLVIFGNIVGYLKSKNSYDLKDLIAGVIVFILLAIVFLVLINNVKTNRSNEADDKQSKSIKRFVCSRCGKVNTKRYHICPYCGAKGAIKTVFVEEKPIVSAEDNLISASQEEMISEEAAQPLINVQETPSSEKQDHPIEETVHPEKTIVSEAPVVMQDDSLKNQLKELKELFDEGLITEEEYNIKKKQVLGL